MRACTQDLASVFFQDLEICILLSHCLVQQGFQDPNADIIEIFETFESIPAVSPWGYWQIQWQRAAAGGGRGGQLRRAGDGVVSGRLTGPAVAG